MRNVHVACINMNFLTFQVSDVLWIGLHCGCVPAAAHAPPTSPCRWAASRQTPDAPLKASQRDVTFALGKWRTLPTLSVSTSFSLAPLSPSSLTRGLADLPSPYPWLCRFYPSLSGMESGQLRAKPREGDEQWLKTRPPVQWVDVPRGTLVALCPR